MPSDVPASSQPFDGTVQVAAATPWNDTGIYITSESEVTLSLQELCILQDPTTGRRRQVFLDVLRQQIVQ